MDKEAASRVTSLNPSASFYVRNRDRPSYMPMRSASMRETSYSRSIRRSRQRNLNKLNVSGGGGGGGDDTLSVTNESNIGANSARSSVQNLAIEEVNGNGTLEE